MALGMASLHARMLQSAESADVLREKRDTTLDKAVDRSYPMDECRNRIHQALQPKPAMRAVRKSALPMREPLEIVEAAPCFLWPRFAELAVEPIEAFLGNLAEIKATREYTLPITRDELTSMLMASVLAGPESPASPLRDACFPEVPDAKACFMTAFRMAVELTDELTYIHAGVGHQLSVDMEAAFLRLLGDRLKAATWALEHHLHGMTPPPFEYARHAAETVKNRNELLTRTLRLAVPPDEWCLVDLTRMPTVRHLTMTCKEVNANRRLRKQLVDAVRQGFRNDQSAKRFEQELDEGVLTIHLTMMKGANDDDYPVSFMTARPLPGGWRYVDWMISCGPALHLAAPTGMTASGEIREKLFYDMNCYSAPLNVEVFGGIGMAVHDVDYGCDYVSACTLDPAELASCDAKCMPHSAAAALQAHCEASSNADRPVGETHTFSLDADCAVTEGEEYTAVAVRSSERGKYFYEVIRQHARGNAVLLRCMPSRDGRTLTCVFGPDPRRPESVKSLKHAKDVLRKQFAKVYTRDPSAESSPVRVECLAQ